ncbi:hypothetical protein SAMN05421875_101349 [Acidovorax soli]|uniref:Uncharacterized protein n=1 Tax=Acidovorax soli TaxID=592050 RepID=A0A1H3VRZ6_9BURK|nr:hypothetical protein SAMN05421875_101349 [Acidovorax soli]
MLSGKASKIFCKFIDGHFYTVSNLLNCYGELPLTSQVGLLSYRYADDFHQISRIK